MSIRTKMKLDTITEEKWGSEPENSVHYLNFSCVYDPTLPEDKRFQKATPFGTAKFQVDNQSALDQFVPGQYYYVDFSPILKE